MKIILVLFLLSVFVVFIHCSRKKSLSSTNKIPNITEDLERLDYFIYAEGTDISSLKAEIQASYLKSGQISSIWNEQKPYQPLDYRLFSLDGEDLAEHGLDKALHTLNPSFQKMNIQMIWKVSEVFENQGIQRTIVNLNGKDYFFDYPQEENSWGLSSKLFADMLNDQLEKQNSKERVYLISGGNEGLLIFLTQGQYNYIEKYFVPQMQNKLKNPGKYWRMNLPLPPKDWFEFDHKQNLS